MKTEYHLEIYEPNDETCVAASYKSNSPFMSINVGDIINGQSLNLSDAQSPLRVKMISHIFWEIENSHTTHKTCIFTEPYQS